MDADLDTLATALYACIDDTLKARPDLQPWRPRVGIAPKLSDAELLMLALLQVLVGHGNETGWLRYAGKHLSHLFPYLPGQAGYNKRLRKSAAQLQAMIRLLATDTDVWADDTWLIDSTPIECGRSRTTTQRSNLAGWAGYGYCASHSRFFWGLRLHLVCTPAGCRSPSLWRTRKSTNATSPWTCSKPNPACSPDAAGRQSSPTRDTSRRSSSVDSPTTASNSSAPPAPTSPAVEVHLSCDTSTDHRIGEQHPQSPAQC
jgi:hypothetical protein